MHFDPAPLPAAMDGHGLKHTNTPSGSTHHLFLLEDLLGPLLLLASLALVGLLELTRRQICSLYQLTFLLTSVYAMVAIGGLLDHQFLNEELHVALYPAQMPSSLRGSFMYLPVVLICISSIAFLMQLSSCSCDCCCLIGEGDGSSSSSSGNSKGRYSDSNPHRQCFAFRLRANWPVYCGCFGALFFCMGMRLNVRLHESAVTPVGGTLHWQMLRSPFYWSVGHIGSLVLVLLKVFLQHADNRPVRHLGNNPSALLGTPSAMASSLEELMRPPAIKHIPSLYKRANSVQEEDEEESASDDSDKDTTVSAPSVRPRAATTNSVLGKTPLGGAERITLLSGSNGSKKSSGHTRAAVKKSSIREGDNSSHISSDSDEEDHVRKPIFTGLQAMNHPTTAPKSPRRLSSSSGYSTTSPTASASMIRRTRVGSSTSSSTFASENEWDGGGSLSSSSTTRYERPRAPRAPIAPVGKPTALVNNHQPSPTGVASFKTHQSATSSLVSSTSWIECVDATSGSVYFYNQLTQESTWTRPAEFVAAAHDQQHTKWQ